MPISPANLDPQVRTLLIAARRVAVEQGVEFFVCGAYARDLVLEGVHGVASPRGTRDVDIAVAVPNWEAHDRFFAALVADGVLVRIPGKSHRLALAGSTMTVDSIAFGGIEDPAGTVTMPPDFDHRMTVTGFDDVARCALELEVGEGITVPVASICGLAILKLLAWNDRGARTRKDATDIAFILRHYGHPVMSARLYGESSALLEAEDYETTFAGARLLGRDMAEVMSRATAAWVETILEQELGEPSGGKLARAMTGIDLDGTEFERSLALLARVLAGIRDSR